MCSSPCRTIMSGAILLLALELSVIGSSKAVEVVLRVVDRLGQDIPARVHVKDASGSYFPGYPDGALLSHRHWPWMGGYFYYQGQPVTMNLSPGTAHIEVSKGPEWTPAKVTVALNADTTIAVLMRRTFDMNSLGWFSGDSHVHTNHTPVDYPVPPAAALRIAEAEDLNMMWILDQSHHFTGGPHPYSTATNILYYTYEYRNQACGHVELLGAKTPMSFGCCVPPYPASPFLSKYREEWNPGWDELMVLAHPETGAHFFQDDGWPGWGLGREFPVLATSGSLDAYAAASYGNVQDLAFFAWYCALSCGYMIPPSAGTDAMCCRYWSRPPGGYRVYVKESGDEHSASTWAEGLKAGRVFITNCPLIPLFEVNGKGAGEMLELKDGPALVNVQYRVCSTLPVTTLELIYNGEVVASIPLSSSHGQQSWEGEHELSLKKSGWVAGRVVGTTNRQVIVSPDLIAHTGAVEIRINSLLPVNSAAAGFLFDKADSLEMFVEMRGGWQNEAQRQDALTRIQDTRDRLSRHFVIPPDSFHLLFPADGDTVYCEQADCLRWEEAIDPEEGDRIRYWVTVSPDPDFEHPLRPLLVHSNEASLSDFTLMLDRQYWWRVEACDRGGNCTQCAECSYTFFFHSNVSSVTEMHPNTGPDSDDSGDLDGRSGGYREETGAEAANRSRLRIRPNPSAGFVRIALYSPGSAMDPSCSIRLAQAFDPQGRCIRSLKCSSEELLWDGNDDFGRQVPSGVYWIRLTCTSIRASEPPGASPAGCDRRCENPITARVQIVR